jgi:hypothetical protein
MLNFIHIHPVKTMEMIERWRAPPNKEFSISHSAYRIYVSLTLERKKQLGFRNFINVSINLCSVNSPSIIKSCEFIEVLCSHITAKMNRVESPFYGPQFRGSSHFMLSFNNPKSIISLLYYIHIIISSGYCSNPPLQTEILTGGFTVQL